MTELDLELTIITCIDGQPEAKHREIVGTVRVFPVVIQKASVREMSCIWFRNIQPVVIHVFFCLLEAFPVDPLFPEGSEDLVEANPLVAFIFLLK